MCGLWLVAVATPGERRPALLRAALLVLCVALVVAPWTARNWTVFERLVPLSTVGWLAAGEGNTLEHPDWLKAAGPERRRFKNHFFAIEDELERVEYARAYTFERVREEQPGWLPKKLVRNLGLLWSPNDTLFERIGKGSYGEVSTGTVRALFLAHLVLYTGLVVLAVLGIAAAPFDRRLLGVMLLGTVCALHVLLNATPRYRVPWLPLLSVYAAYAVVAGRQLFASDARRRLAAALLALALLAGVVATRFPAEAASIWSHGG